MENWFDKKYYIETENKPTIEDLLQIIREDLSSKVGMNLPYLKREKLERFLRETMFQFKNNPNGFSQRLNTTIIATMITLSVFGAEIKKEDLQTYKNLLAKYNIDNFYLF